MRALPILLCSALLLPAAELPREIQTLIDLARSSPPELFADAALRLVHSGRIAPREAQLELLEEAFTASGAASEPVRLTAFPLIPPDTRELYRSLAGELQLDSLSLQSRILQELLTLDPAKARELFASIPRPAFTPRPCEDPFIAVAPAYYELAGAIAQSAFSPAEKEKESHVQFISAILDGIHSPSELVPFARALQSVAWTAQEWALLGAAFAEKLTTIAPDYRPFAMSFDTLQGEIATLQELSQVYALKDAFRTYTIHQLTAARCAPDLALDTRALDLTPEQTNPHTRKESFKTSDVYFTSGDAKLLRDEFTRLQSKPRGPELKAALADFLRDYLAWRPEGSAADLLHQRATVLRALFQSLPQGDDRDKVMQISVSMLASSQAQRESPPEWLWEVHELASIASQDAPKLTASLRGSGNATLRVYADLLK
jgi:hypothetical protein